MPANAGKCLFKPPVRVARCDGPFGVSRQSEPGPQVVGVGESVSDGWQGCGPCGGDELVVHFKADDPGVSLEGGVKIGARD